MSCDLKTERISAQTKLKNPNDSETLDLLREKMSPEKYNAYIDLISSEKYTSIFNVERTGRLGVKVTTLNGYHYANSEYKDRDCVELSPSVPCIYVEIAFDTHTFVKGNIIYDYVNREVYMDEVYHNDKFIPNSVMLYSF